MGFNFSVHFISVQTFFLNKFEKIDENYVKNSPIPLK